MPVNPKKYIDKLMKALETKGRYYNYSMKRFYSKNVDRYVMKYILEDMQNKKRRLEVYNKLEILKFLVREWSEVSGQPVPEACLEPFKEEEEEVKLSQNKIAIFDNYKMASRGYNQNGKVKNKKTKKKKS